MSDDLRDEVALILTHAYDDQGVGAYFREHKQAADALAPLLARREAEARAAAWDDAVIVAMALLTDRGLVAAEPAAHRILAASEPKP